MTLATGRRTVTASIRAPANATTARPLKLTAAPAAQQPAWKKRSARPARRSTASSACMCSATNGQSTDISIGTSAQFAGRQPPRGSITPTRMTIICATPAAIRSRTTRSVPTGRWMKRATGTHAACAAQNQTRRSTRTRIRTTFATSAARRSRTMLTRTRTTSATTARRRSRITKTRTRTTSATTARRQSRTM